MEGFLHGIVDQLADLTRRLDLIEIERILHGVIDDLAALIR
jgi:hypothetical protein